MSQPRAHRLVGTRLSAEAHARFKTAERTLGRSRSSIVREAILRWLDDHWGDGASPEALISARAEPSIEPSAGPVPTLPRTKAAYQGNAKAIRPSEGQKLGARRAEGALLGSAQMPKRPDSDGN